MKQNNNASKGFTLAELLITLLIVAVLLLVAVPITQDFLLKKKVAAQTQEVVTALQYARNQAETVGKVLTLAPRQQDWSTGFRLFVDQNNNHFYDDADQFLFEWPWKGDDIMLTWNGLYPEYLLFSPQGMKNGLAGTFEICPMNTRFVKTQSVIMNRFGRIRVEESEKTCHN